MTEKEQEIQVESAVAGLLEKVNNTSLEKHPCVEVYIRYIARVPQPKGSQFRSTGDRMKAK